MGSKIILLYYPGRITDSHTVWRDAFRHHAAGSDDAPFPDIHTRQDHDLFSNPGKRADRDGLANQWLQAIWGTHLRIDPVVFGDNCHLRRNENIVFYHQGTGGQCGKMISDITIVQDLYGPKRSFAILITGQSAETSQPHSLSHPDALWRMDNQSTTDGGAGPHPIETKQSSPIIEIGKENFCKTFQLLYHRLASLPGLLQVPRRDGLKTQLSSQVPDKRKPGRQGRAHPFQLILEILSPAQNRTR